MIEVRMGKDPMFVYEMLIEPYVLGMDMKNPIDEFPDRFDVVHVLEDQVGGVVVEPKVGAR